MSPLRHRNCKQDQRSLAEKVYKALKPVEKTQGGIYGLCLLFKLKIVSFEYIWCRHILHLEAIRRAWFCLFLMLLTSDIDVEQFKKKTFKELSYGSLFTSTKKVAFQCHFSALGMIMDAVLFKGKYNCKISEIH